MSRYKKFFVYLTLAIVPVTGWAQEGILWQWEPEFSYTRQLNNRWSANLKAGLQQTFNELVAENNGREYQINYGQVQLFGTYKLWPTTQLTGGYGYRLSDLLEEQLGYEHRTMEQITFVLYFRETRVANRFRAEQRFGDRTFINRWRYRLAYETPLQGQELNPGETYFITSNELLFSFNATEQFAENRLYVGVGWYFNDREKLEAGLQYRLGEIGTGQLTNVIWLTTACYLNH